MAVTTSKQLTNAKRSILIGKLYDLMTSGYMSTNALSKATGVARRTVEAYKPLVNELIAKSQYDRTTIRHLELQRAYKLIEMLMQDLDKATEHKDRIGYYNQIAKHSSRIALITGLNIETQVNVDQRQLVIIRADNHRKPIIDFSSDKADIPPVTESKASEAPETS